MSGYEKRHLKGKNFMLVICKISLPIEWKLEKIQDSVNIGICISGIK